MTSEKDALSRRAWSRSSAWRNRLVHAYFDIDRDILWKTVTEEIPDLIPLLAASLPEAENES